MYNHLDQSWKSQPKLMSDNTLEKTTQRIQEYAIHKRLDRIAIVYHGGEPLLMSTDKLVAHAKSLKNSLPDVIVEFSLQTNGVLLKEDDILKFQDADIQVSLSLDGPADANDRHRLDHRGLSSYAGTEQALTLLEKYPKVFSGVIAVIDADNDPKEVLDFFAQRSIPQLDFLLPDANYATVPPGINKNPNRYLNWLLTCFDTWFDNYPSMKIRTFDAILASLMGVPSETDGFGLGDVSLITIETDGSYHDLDVLKITGEGTDLINGSVYFNDIEEALKSKQVAKHRALLRKEGLTEICQACSVVDICGGGAVAHRFSENGFQNPSIYCRELKGLIEHANKRVMEQIQSEIDHQESSSTYFPLDLLPEYESVSEDNSALQIVRGDFIQAQTAKFRSVIDNIHISILAEPIKHLNCLSPNELGEIVIRPEVVTWTDVMQKDMSGIQVHDISGQTILPDPYYISEIASLTKDNNIDWPKVQNESVWLRAPFGDKIYFENKNISDAGIDTLQRALALILEWKPLLIKEMHLISPEVQYIRDLSAHPDKVVSFSDNSVPGALYVQLMRGNHMIAPEDLSDSIIHEHRHQKLYMLQRVAPIVNSDYPLVASPWREELRPPSGLFHALFVFVELLDFWMFLKHSPDKEVQIKAQTETKRVRGQLQTGFDVVEKCDLTAYGRNILSILQTRYLTLQYENNPSLTTTS
ncbi:FxsB family cyclophane-forming radical SAM/SPASM peptide maturase [Pedobacter sp. P26]|uniref:FxsB family cyclophane-forming radical SAM/SPASM peptide maturase n=1 Tax=Pedobacter sp. P26 TaxID=3423956 RepID=UPI003D670768